MKGNERTFTFDRLNELRLEEIAARQGVNTGKALAMSITLMYWLLQQVESGKTLAIIDKDANKIYEYNLDDWLRVKP